MLRRIKGFTLIELLIVVAIIAILAAIAVPNFLEAQTRSKVSRVKNDERALATALEAYYVDNNAYPAYSTSTGSGTTNGGMCFGANSDSELMKRIPTPGQGLPYITTFRIKKNQADQLATLTTPIAYITALMSDPFADTKGAIFAYAVQYNTGWLVWSYGPDSDENQTTKNTAGGDIKLVNQNGDQPRIDETYYNPGNTVPSQELIKHTYDPSNGTTSDGDVWRQKQ